LECKQPPILGVDSATTMVDEMRANPALNVATITVLPATQTIDILSNAQSDRFHISQELNGKLSSQCKIPADLKQTTIGITAAQARLDLLDKRCECYVAATLAKLNILFHCSFLLRSRKKYMLEVDAISVHEGQSFFTDATEGLPNS